MNRKLRMGMVGGGGGFIGNVHRMAAMLDNEASLTAGAFSSNPERSVKFGAEFHLDPGRVYRDYREMIAAESELPADRRLDFVSIVVPNNEHFAVAKTCLEAGFNVVCDKPMTTTLAEARELERIVKSAGKVFALTHNYTGYPMVKQARELVRSGRLGRINRVAVEYPQGWLANMISDRDSGMAIWRMDPEVSGGSCTMGDIGTHCENLVRYISGLELETLCADLAAFVPANPLDDDGCVLMRYKGGARGVMLASQICTGEENALKVRIYGDKGGIEWRQENPNYLWFKDIDGTVVRYARGNANLCAEAQAAARLPHGHPEGFIEAFANIYREAFRAIRAEVAGKDIPPIDAPCVYDGVYGMAFIETVLKSHASDAKWTPFAL